MAGKVRLGEVSLGEAGHGLAGALGRVRDGYGMVRLVSAGMASRGKVRHDTAWRGEFWHGRHGSAW